MNYPKVFGTYYTVLGWIGAIGLVAGVVMAFFTDELMFDFSFIIWFMLGASLRRASRTARKWAMGISAFFALFILTSAVMGIGQANVGPLTFKPPHTGFYLMIAGLFLVFVVPGLLLLSPEAKEQFTSASRRFSAR